MNIRCLPWSLGLGFLIGALLAPGRSEAQEWTRFRGPNGSGISEATTVPSEWTDADLNWKIELPGMGHSCPVLWGDKIFLTSAEDESALRHVLAIDAVDGRILWTRSYSSTLHKKHQLNSFASPTAAVDEERVYVAWSSPEEYSLRAFDHEGSEVWHRPLGPFVSQHSCGTSPIVFKDLVVLGNDQDGPSFLVAINRRTGEVVWQTPRKNRDQATAYSTPCVYQPAGGPPELIFNSGVCGVSSINPENGQLNWELPVFDKRTVSSPVLAGGLVIGTCGSGGGGSYVAAVRPGAADGSRQPELVYKITKSAPYVPTPVVKDDLLFVWSDQGVVSCARAESGDVVWQNRVGGAFFGSPVCVADRLFGVSDAGEVVVVAAAPEFKLLGRSQLGEGSHSTPAVAGGVMYLRTYSHLFSVGGRKS